MMGPATPLSSDAVPPIILLVEDDFDTREMYMMALEQSGMWVATAPDAGTAGEAVLEIKPDLIVTDLGFENEERTLDFAHTVKEDRATADIPLVMLSGRSATEASRDRTGADLFLLKPIPPDDLTGHIATLLQRARDVRARNQVALQRAARLIRKSNELLAGSRAIDAQVQHRNRRCPSCARRLQWVETGRIEGIEYDYYNWCDRGCGLYCYERAAQRWVKIAG